MSIIKQIIFFGDKVTEFYLSQDDKVRLKMNYVFDLVRFEQQVPRKFYKKLENNPWVGNIRELRNTLERSLILMDDNVLSVEDLPHSISGNSFALPMASSGISIIEHFNPLLLTK